MSSNLPPVGGTPTPPPLSGASGDDLPEAVITDTIAPAPSIVGVAQTVGLANANFRAVQYETAQKQIELLSGIFSSVGLDAATEINTLTQRVATAINHWQDFYDANQAMGEALQTYQSGMQNAANNLNTTISVNNWQDVYDNVQAMGPHITSYLSSMQSALNDLNTVIGQYKTGGATQGQLNTAIVAYNMATSAATSTYSAQVSAYNTAISNADITTLNAQLQELGLPQISPVPTFAPSPLSLTTGPFAPPSILTSPESMDFVGIRVGANYVASFQQRAPSFSLSQFSAVPPPPHLSPPRTSNLTIATATYEAVVTILNSTYSHAQENYNDLLPITTLNAELLSVGIPAIPTPTAAQDPFSVTSGAFAPPAANATPPFQVVGNAALGEVTVTPISSVATPPTVQQGISTYLPSLIVNVISVYVPASKSNTNLQKFLASLYSSSDPFLGDITLPSAYYKPQKVTVSSASSASPGGTNSTVGSIGFGSPVLARVLFQTLYQALQQEAIKGLPPQTFSQMQSLTFSLLEKIVPEAAATAARQLPGRGSDEFDRQPNTVSTVNTTVLASKVQEFTASEAVNLAVQNSLSTIPEFASRSPEDQTAAVNAISAGIKDALLRITLSIFASEVGVPGLIPQVLGNVQGQPPLETTLANTDVSRTNRVLEDTISITALKEKFNSDVVSRAIDDVLLKGNIRSIDDFTQALGKSLIALQVEAARAQAIAEEATAFIKNESNLPSPESPFYRTPLQTALQALSNLPAGLSASAATSSVITAAPDLASVFPAGSPNRFLLENLIGNALKNGVISAQLQTVLSGTITSNRDFYNQVVTGLTAKGVSSEDAAKVATLATQLITPSRVIPSTTEPIPVVSERVASTVTDNLKSELGDQRTRNIAAQVAQTATNFVKQFDDVQFVVKQQDKKTADQKFTDSIGSLSNPNIMLDALNFIIPQFVVQHQINAYQTPADQGDLGQIDVNKQPVTWRGSYIFPV
jgi:hypothetical protein